MPFRSFFILKIKKKNIRLVKQCLSSIDQDTVLALVIVIYFLHLLLYIVLNVHKVHAGFVIECKV